VPKRPLPPDLTPEGAKGPRAWLFVTALTSWALGLSSSPWVVLAMSIFAAALFLRVLTEADGIVCLLLAAILGGAVTLAAGHEHSWLFVAVSSGYALHLLGDVITVEGIPPFFPFGPQVRVPIIGAVGHWRERAAGALCGLVAFYLLVTMVFLPGWQEQQRQLPVRSASASGEQVEAMAIAGASSHRRIVSASCAVVVGPGSGIRARLDYGATA
jgi:hypothetical protein